MGNITKYLCRNCQLETVLFIAGNGNKIIVRKCGNCGLYFVIDLYSGVILKAVGEHDLDNLLNIIKECELLV